MGSMTTVEEFAASVNSTLQFLEAGLPRGSTVILIGLAQGTTLYNVTHNQTHPIGTSYPALYDYLSCLGVNPCWGWLNTNATWRAATQARADQLNAEYGRIVAEWQAQHPSGTYQIRGRETMRRRHSLRQDADPYGLH
jgi:acyloxyacyl hydrolase